MLFLGDHALTYPYAVISDESNAFFYHTVADEFDEYYNYYQELLDSVTAVPQI